MRPEDLGADEHRIIAALVDSPLAWATVAVLARLSGLTADRFEAALSVLGSAEYLDAWPEWPIAPALTFSPLGAERLDLRLIEVGSSEIPRWATADRPDPMRVRSRRPEWSYDLPVALRPLDLEPFPGFAPCDASPSTCSGTPDSTSSSSRSSSTPSTRSRWRSYRSFRELIEACE